MAPAGRPPRSRGMLGFLFRWLDCEPPLREGQILAYAGVSVLGVKRFSGGQGQGVGRRPGVHGGRWHSVVLPASASLSSALLCLTCRAPASPGRTPATPHCAARLLHRQVQYPPHLAPTALDAAPASLPPAVPRPGRQAHLCRSAEARASSDCPLSGRLLPVVCWATSFSHCWSRSLSWARSPASAVSGDKSKAAAQRDRAGARTRIGCNRQMAVRPRPTALPGGARNPRWVRTRPGRWVRAGGPVPGSGRRCLPGRWGGLGGAGVG